MELKVNGDADAISIREQVRPNTLQHPQQLRSVSYCDLENYCCPLRQLIVVIPVCMLY